jgi:hypothetical protein
LFTLPERVNNCVFYFINILSTKFCLMTSFSPILVRKFAALKTQLENKIWWNSQAC